MNTLKIPMWSVLNKRGRSKAHREVALPSKRMQRDRVQSLSILKDLM